MRGHSEVELPSWKHVALFLGNSSYPFSAFISRKDDEDSANQRAQDSVLPCFLENSGEGMDEGS